MHIALLLGPLAFLVVAKTVGQTAERPELLVVGVALAVLLAGISFVLPKAVLGRLSKPDSRAPLEQMLPAYQSTKIIQWAMVEGAALFNRTVVFVSGNPVSFGCALALFGLLAFHRPSRDDFARLCAIPAHRLHELDA